MRCGAALWLLLAACGSKPTLEPRLSVLQAQVFTTSCATADCHSAADKKANLVLEAGATHASLIGVLADQPAARERGMVLVAPGNPYASFLFRKVEQSAALLAADEGDPMPLNQARLSAELIEAVREWIAKGAPDD